jgi:hypothetical protein
MTVTLSWLAPLLLCSALAANAATTIRAGMRETCPAFTTVDRHHNIDRFERIERTLVQLAPCSELFGGVVDPNFSDGLPKSRATS